jgi:hypothetical protein
MLPTRRHDPTLAQTVFEGKAVDLTETRDYGSLIAAGLGQEWSGFGRTVFVNPMEQAWQQVLTPAADSLNAQWQQAVVAEWNSAFGGRYPFNNASSDVSLPLLAKYLNADSGRIAQFLQTRLKGVLHKEGNHWVPDSINSQGLAFNPAFLNAINTLSHISDVAFTEGNAGMNFDLRPGTADGVMQTDMIIDSQKLTYMNQLPAWKRFTWPADTEAPGANLSWISTQAGTRQYADIPGAWGWIRLLDKAAVSAYPGVGSSYSLSWKAQDGRTLNYTLRTEAGEGPLALLKLRNFRLPETIFSTTGIAPSDQATDTASDDGDVLMSTLNALLSACQTEQEPLLVATRERVAQWDSWLQPLSGQSSAGEDPGYDDDFQQMREEVNKLSGADTELICRLAEKLLTTIAKDIRVATYYCWAKLHREGEQGLAEGLELLAGLLERFGPQLHPQRDRSRKAALEWLAGSRMTDSLSLYPEVVRIDAMRTTGALLLISQLIENEPDETRPNSIRFIARWKVVCRKREAWMRWYRRMPVPAKPLRLPATAMPRPSGGSPPVRICWPRPVPLLNICASSRTAGCQHTI